VTAGARMARTGAVGTPRVAVVGTGPRRTRCSPLSCRSATGAAVIAALETVGRPSARAD